MLKTQPRDFEISLETKGKWTIGGICHGCREAYNGGNSLTAAEDLPITQAPTTAELGKQSSGDEAKAQ